MTEAVKPTIRRRLNIKYSTKGVATTDATFEADGLTNDEFKGFAVEYFNWVDRQFPPVKEGSSDAV